ncbi:MAG: hypothetical protein RLY47_324 [Candidatus Parcubacteria bacterium]|jgi:WD40 repeat protein
MKALYRSIFALLAVLVIAPFFVQAAPTLSETLDAVKNKYTFSDQINVVVTDGDTLYLGGSFSQVSKIVGNAVLFTEETGERVETFPRFERVTPGDEETVFAVTDDGVGGWYVGGDFDTVNGESLYSLAHVLSDGSIDTDFDPVFILGDMVLALALSPDGETLYVGGDFSEINGTTRNRLAAINTSDGTLTAFNPNLTNIVKAIVLSPDGETLYVGGTFVSVNGQSAYGLAALNTTDGSLVPGVDFGGDITFPARPNSLALSSGGDILYVGGGTTEFGIGDGYDALFAFDTSDGSQLVFDPNVNDDILAMALSDDDSTLYIGGVFTDVNSGTTRNKIAAVDTTDGSLVEAFDPNVGAGFVYSLALSSDETTLYAGGSFTAVNGGTTRNRIAALAVSDGTATAEDFGGGFYDGTVYALSSVNGQLLAGGSMTQADRVSRSEVAAIDLATYELTDFNPNVVSVDQSVHALALSPDAGTLYIGGAFNGINGIGGNRYSLAAVTTIDGVMTDFNPNMGGGYTVYSLVVSSDGSTVYAGGDFEEWGVGGDVYYVAKMDAGTGAEIAFTPSLDGEVRALKLSSDGNSLYAGGDFTEKLVALDTTDGSTLLSTEFPADDTVRALTLSSDGETLYAGGEFTEFTPGLINIGEGGIFDATTGSFVDSQSIFSTNASTVHASIPDGNGGWYAGGSFNRIDGGVWDSRIAHILPDMTIDPTFEPDFGSEGGTVRALALSSDGETLYAGGEFTTINSTTRNRLAAFDTSDGSLTNFDPDMNGDVYALQLSSDEATLYAAGNFLVVNGATDRGHVAGFNTSDGVATDFAPSLNNGATSLALSSDDLTLYVGGSFSCVEYDSGLEVCNADRNYLAALDTTETTSVATAFNPDMNSSVYSLELSDDDSVLFAGGDFYCVGGYDDEEEVCLGSERYRLAAIDTDDGLAMPFAPDANSTVYALSLSSDESVLYAGGGFTNISGENVAGLVALNTSDATLTEFSARLNTSFGYDVYTISGPVNGNIFAGGGVLRVLETGGGARAGLAAFSTSDLGLLDFDPDFAEGGAVYSLALTSDDEVLYAGGSFNSEGGALRDYLAAIQTSNASVLDFNPTDAYYMYALALHPDGDELYVGGSSGWFGIYDSEDVDEVEDDGETRSGSHRKPLVNPPSFRDDTTLLESLQARIEELKAILASLLGIPSTTSDIYTRDLDLNSKGPDVTALQLFLIAQNKGPQAQALAAVGATGFFGPLTQAALAEYQASVGITPAAGYFGPVTRAYINGL